MTLPTWHLENQLQQACAELDRELRAGRDCRAEHFLTCFPGLAASHELALELIYTEFVAREELGQQPQAEEYYQRFPQWQDTLREQFHVHTLLRESIRPRSGFEEGLSTEDEERWIGPYKVLEEIARGTTGVVYRAWHPLLRRTVALKVILAGSDAGPAERRRFRNEAEAVARLRHPNIVQIYEVGEAEGRPFLALEFVEGETLARQLGGRPQPGREAAAFVEALARAIHHAHQAGIVHRDLKPANILLAERGPKNEGRGTTKREEGKEREGVEPSPHSSLLTPHSSLLTRLSNWTPRIVDFGLAKLMDRTGSLTEAGAVFGTPSYMAPEQAAGRSTEVSPATDIYALGAILYEMLTGRPPFRGDSVLQTLQQVIAAEPLPPDWLQPDVPHDLATVCLKCLEKEPRKRYSDSLALAEDLRRFGAGEPIRARRTGPAERVWKWAWRRPAVAALLASLGGALVAILLAVIGYNARLQTVLGQVMQQRTETEKAATEAQVLGIEAQKAAAEALRQKTEAQHQSALALRQSDTLRGLMFTMQLARVEERWSSDSSQALALLEDRERCPLELRDFTWGLFHHLCSHDRFLPFQHRPGVLALAFAPDGRRLALAGDDDGHITLCDLVDAYRFSSLKGHQKRTRCVLFATDGRTMASGGTDGIVRLWPMANDEEVVTLRGHEGEILALACSSDGRILASAGKDGTVRLWDMETATERAILRGHTAPVTALAFAPDNQRLATGSADGSVRLWDPTTMSQDYGRGSLRLAEPGAITCLAFAPDGRRLAVAGARRPTVSLFDADTLQPTGSCRGHADQVLTLAFSPDSRLLASGGEDRTVRLWDSDGGAPQLVFQGSTGCIRSVAFSPDGRWLASAGDDPRLQLHDLSLRIPPHRSERDLDQRRRADCIDGLCLRRPDLVHRQSRWHVAVVGRRCQDGAGRLARTPRHHLVAGRDPRWPDPGQQRRRRDRSFLERGRAPMSADLDPRPASGSLRGLPS